MKSLFTVAAMASLSAFADVSLDGAWKLDFRPQDGRESKTIEAQVPGNVELDLVRAGLEKDPMIGDSVYGFRKYEGYCWTYSRSFQAPKLAAGERAVLRFAGIDTLAEVFMNGAKIGVAENMLIPHEFDVTDNLKQGQANSLEVRIRSVILEGQKKTLGQLGYSMSGGADGEPFRKAAHMYGWDIMPRLVSAGIFRPVTLAILPPVRIDQINWVTVAVDTKNKSAADVAVAFRAHGPFSILDKTTVRVTLKDGEKEVFQTQRVLRHFQERLRFHVSNIKLWQTRGLGEAKLYDAKVELIAEDGKVMASDESKIGFRSVELVRDDVYSKDRPGQFLFKVNGEPVFIKGTNWSPLDALHSRDSQHLLKTLQLVSDMNCNMIRVWGGGVYEDDAFFDYCDANGILIWQDFCTGCSVFPQNDEYAKATAEEVRAVTLRLRNHPSLALWSGNNENDQAFAWGSGRNFHVDPNRDRNSRKTIPDELFELDATRPYLPSSPYYSPDVFAGKARASEDHLWGPRGYYKTPFYTNSPAWFVSEIGYHGCPNLDSLKKMMEPQCVYPWIGEVDTWNAQWQCKATMPFTDSASLARRNNLMTKQVKLMFGEVSKDLPTFVKQSQTVQAEAMKYFVELFRSRKFTRANGIIWWNIRDGWPILSDAVVDWYFGKKLAYHYLKTAQRDVLALVTDQGDVVVVNDTSAAVKGSVTIADASTGKVLFEGEWEAPANGKTTAGKVALEGKGVCNILYKTPTGTYKNHFLHGEPPFDFAKISELLPKAEE